NDFTWKDFQARNNNELVAIFGNFINRVVVLTNKYYNGVVPTPNGLSQVDEETLAAVKAYPEVIASSIERYRFREAQQEMMNLARLGNKYLADEEPWKVIKTDEARTQTIMYVALQIATALATLSEPFLPFTSIKLKNILKVSSSNSTQENGIENLWNDITSKEVLLPSGHTIGEAELLFTKIEDETIQFQLDKLEASKKANEAAKKVVEPQKDTITFDDFTKLDIRVGTILEAEKMPKAKKLLVLKVDTGIDVRTIVSGIAESFTPEEVVGKRVTVLVNLSPRELRGVVSQGMILMTENTEGKLVFVNPDDANVANGLHIS
ncbi:MAG TPA: methionine--tRNA ligase subunit beta, partial [Flavobacteriaceae bacterium]|nr:methionine--tRNA ligase subunit beta [Flavobacteriaceae bacterium]